MHAACEGGNPLVVELLIDRGCDLAAETNDGRNAVCIAAQFGWKELVAMLLDFGAPRCSRPRCVKCKLTMRLLRRQDGGTRRAPKRAATDGQKKACERQIRSRPCRETD